MYDVFSEKTHVLIKLRIIWF